MHAPLEHLTLVTFAVNFAMFLGNVHKKKASSRWTSKWQHANNPRHAPDLARISTGTLRPQKPHPLREGGSPVGISGINSSLDSEV